MLQSWREDEKENSENETEDPSEEADDETGDIEEGWKKMLRGCIESTSIKMKGLSDNLEWTFEKIKSLKLIYVILYYLDSYRSHN